MLSALQARYLARAVAKAEEAARKPRLGTALRQVERFIDALLESTMENSALIWILFHQTAVEEDELSAVHDALLRLVRHQGPGKVV